MPRLARLLLALVLLPVAAAQPAVRTDTLDLDAVVVTATRTERALEDVAVPTTVVGAQAIEAQGAARLSDVLAAVPGLFLFDDHGSGLQVQGFAPDYTLILIDGEPVVGRTAGTLDLSRLSVAGVERVEVVRGPTSSLYGSDALAGVVNVITSRPREGVSGQARLRGGSFGTSDATLSLGLGRGGDAAGAWAVRVLANRYASGGYDLTPDAFGTTAPSFDDWTGDVRARVALGRGAVLRLGARAAVQDQRGASESGDRRTRYDDTGERTDWSIHPELDVPLTGRLRLTASMYGARYVAGLRQREIGTGALTFATDFDQRYTKAEAQLDALWSARHATTWGAGATDERLGGDRYGDGVEPAAQQVFAFGQHLWAPSRTVEVTASARLDAHTAYAARVTPKVAVLVRPTDAVRLRASVGSGFKAPDFRQLYLTFTNAAGGGYSVFGSEQLADGLAQLVADGQIEAVLIDPTGLGAIRAENSVSVQAGGSVQPVRGLTLDAGVFHNDVRDLIETQPVAQKTNGQFVYGYFNLARVYTRGLEAQATWRPAGALDLALGYQFLQARDRAVVGALAEGTVFGRDPDGREYRLSLGDYGGLFGRSPHAVTLRAGLSAGGWTTSARARWRSRYGYRDLDGNGVANRPDEFVPAYAVVDLTVTRSWDRVTPVVGASRVTLQAGVDNLFGITRPTLVPSLPGRALYASLGFSF